MRYLAIPLFLGLCASAANWTDRKEYDLVLGIRAETSAQKRIGLLDQWKTKYPKSEFQQVRRELYLAAYQSLGDTPNMWKTAGEMLTAQPGDLTGAYWFALLLPEQRSTTKEQWTLGEKAASVLLAGPKGQADAELVAHRTLGWVHWQRSEYPAAEEELQKCLRLDPDSAQISGWLGTVLALEQKPEKRVAALWQLARASNKQAQFSPVLERLYTSYHGDASGLDQLRAAAEAAPFPPEGFDIESVAAAALRKHDEELTRTDPQMAAWVRVRQKLETADGDQYFAGSLRGKPLTGLKGTLISADPEDKPKELRIGILDPSKAEIVIKLDTELPNPAPAGTVLQFEGTADSYAKTPFSLTVNSEASKITGWPAAGAPEPPAEAAPTATKKR